MSDVTLGPASIPKYLRLAGVDGPLCLVINPRFLSGYQPYIPAIPGLQSIPFDWQDGGPRESLSDWRKQAEASLRWFHKASQDPVANRTFSVPSRELTLKILEIAPSSLGQLGRETVASGQLSEGPHDKTLPMEELEELHQIFGAELLGTIANLAFEAFATGRTDLYLWRNGEIDDSFGLELLRALPIRVGKSESIFRDLNRELLAALRAHEIKGDWGRLQAREKDIAVEPPDRKRAVA